MFDNSDPYPKKVINQRTNKVYSVGMHLGKGAFGNCFVLTEQNSDRTKFAGKFLPLDKRHKWLDEVEILGKLEHRNIVSYVDYIPGREYVCIVMELCGSNSLHRLCKNRDTITEPEARFFIKQVVQGLSYLHEDCHIVHCDLTLKNLLLTRAINVKICDFGQACKLMPGAKINGTCGTPRYRALEIVKGLEYGYKVDVWAVGMILLRLLVGYNLFKKVTCSTKMDEIKSIEYFIQYLIPYHLNANAHYLVSRMVQRDPDMRPSARGILEDRFFSRGFLPRWLPPYCLLQKPRFDEWRKRRREDDSSNSLAKRAKL